MFDHAKIVPIRPIGVPAHAGSYDAEAFPRFAKEFANPGLKPGLVKAKAAVLVRPDDIQIQ